MKKHFFAVMIVMSSCISIVELTRPTVLVHEAVGLLKNVTNEKKKLIEGLGIFPGTKWCGPGNIAKSFDDLGKDEAVDKCCRSHDHCPHHISSGERKYNFYNQMKFTVSDCQCDSDFKKCLDESNGNWIKIIYFTFKTECIILENDTAKLIKSSDYNEDKKANEDNKNLPIFPTNA